MKTILCIWSICALLSCTRTNKIMDSWMGSSKHQLIMNWGPPARTASDGAGGEILVYADEIYIAPSTIYDNSGGASTRPARRYWNYKMFWVNGEGKIYHWKTQRKQIPPQQIDLNIYYRN